MCNCAELQCEDHFASTEENCVIFAFVYFDSNGQKVEAYNLHV